MDFKPTKVNSISHNVASVCSIEEFIWNLYCIVLLSSASTLQTAATCSDQCCNHLQGSSSWL